MTTPIDIVLLGVSFAKPQQNFATSFAVMHLLPEPLFSIPTDGVHIKSVAGTGSGRIFLGGRDGCLYEVVYQVCVIHEKQMCLITVLCLFSVYISAGGRRLVQPQVQEGEPLDEQAVVRAALLPQLLLHRRRFATETLNRVEQ